MEKKKICEKVEIDEKEARKKAREEWRKEAEKRAREWNEKGYEPYE